MVDNQNKYVIGIMSKDCCIVHMFINNVLEAKYLSKIISKNSIYDVLLEKRSENIILVSELYENGKQTEREVYCIIKTEQSKKC